MGEYLLGIDNGGTAIKASVYTPEGRELASASKKTPLLIPRPGYHERDMDGMWKATASAVREVLDKAGLDGSAIACVGCTGHGKGLYLWGRDGRPCYNAIASSDTRAGEYVERWDAEGLSERLSEYTLQSPLACQPAALLRWLKDNEPDAYGGIGHIFSAKDYIRFMLTGQPFSEITDASGSGLLDLRAGGYSEAVTDMYGIGEIHGCLPGVALSHDICGYVTSNAASETGLAQGTPVCGGMFDITACAAAMNICDGRDICVITGTWSINEYISEIPAAAMGSVRNSLYCIPGYYLLEESSPTSAGNLEWYIKTCMGESAGNGDIYRHIDGVLAGDTERDGEVLFIPFLYGSNRRGLDRAGFLNLQFQTTQTQMLRAIFEGVVFSHLTHIDRLLEHRDRPRAMRLSGGAARSPVWSAMFADASGIPVEVVDTTELGTLGCCVSAAVAAGFYGDCAKAARHMSGVPRLIEPDMARHRLYAEKYRRYRQAIDRLAEDKL